MAAEIDLAAPTRGVVRRRATTGATMRALRRDLAYGHLPSPIGTLLLAGDGEALRLISFPEGSRTVGPAEGWRRDDALFACVAAQLRAYFAGELREFDVPLAPDGTGFQAAVWEALRRIPYGETASYGAIAGRIGRPTASRAVGAANGANPIPIIVPCHRVVGSSGSLTGFGGGLGTKRFLLDHERAHGSRGGLL
jgi:methylated-DNA-[protein]-cysteine S-methyltransferase